MMARGDTLPVVFLTGRGRRDGRERHETGRGRFPGQAH
jgi:hypothetical protein